MKTRLYSLPDWQEILREFGWADAPSDKEEIGSMGVTGMQSAAFDTFLHDLCDGQSVPLRVCYENSFCLSCDVTAAYDPNFPEVFEKHNAAQKQEGGQKKDSFRSGRKFQKR